MAKTTKTSIRPTRASKASKIINLLQRNNGATIAELAKAAGWQEHSVRGFISSTLKKKSGLKVESSREEDKARRYFIVGDTR